jgi:hypothetical protein|tara:strand:+ start:9030 stop:9203 length:174 start_codon:yes stop_codon:yes gene_type:complete
MADKQKVNKETSLRDDLMAVVSKLARNMGGGANKALTKTKQRQMEQKEAIEKATGAK